jgi:hypothetical protein
VAADTRDTRTERRSITLPMYIGAAVVLIGGGLFAYLEFGSNRPAPELELTPEAKGYVRNLQLSDVTMQANQSYANQVVVEIQGKIANGGDRPLDLVEIYCVFHDSYGQMVLRKRIPIVSSKLGGLKPGETKSFRLPFDELPDSWNHAMPSLVIAGIKFS